MHSRAHLLLVGLLLSGYELFLVSLHAADTDALLPLLVVKLQGAPMLQTGPLVQIFHRLDQLVAFQPCDRRMVLQVGRAV